MWQHRSTLGRSVFQNGLFQFRSFMYNSRRSRRIDFVSCPERQRISRFCYRDRDKLSLCSGSRWSRLLLLRADFLLLDDDDATTCHADADHHHTPNIVTNRLLANNNWCRCRRRRRYLYINSRQQTFDDVQCSVEYTFAAASLRYRLNDWWWRPVGPRPTIYTQSSLFFLAASGGLGGRGASEQSHKPVRCLILLLLRASVYLLVFFLC